MLAAALLSNPGGWAVLAGAGLGAVGAYLGSKIGGWVGGKIADWRMSPEERARMKRMREAEPERRAAWEKMDREREEADRLKHEQSEREFAELREQIARGPAVPGTMLGTPGDPLSSQAVWGRPSQTSGEEDEEEEMPYVPMALPSR